LRLSHGESPEKVFGFVLLVCTHLVSLSEKVWNKILAVAFVKNLIIFGLKSAGVYESRGKVGKNELRFNAKKTAQQQRAVIPPYIGVLNVIAARLKNLFNVLKKIGARGGPIVVNRD
jgi:hypothetical protein